MVRAFPRFGRHLSRAAVLAGLALVVGGCSDPQGAKNPSRPRASNTEVNRSLDDEVASFMARYPTLLKGKLGTSDTSAYLEISNPRLTDRPYDAEPGVLFPADVEVAGAPHPTEMPPFSRVIVRGQVVAIGLPHFNSGDGSFWAWELHDELSAPHVRRSIFRDVLFRVDEVWGSLLPEIVPGSLVPFVARGGQIAVNLTGTVAEQLGYGSGGVYIFSEESPQDVAVGEDAVVFLDVRPVLGLYRSNLAARFELFPAQESGFKYVYKGPGTIGLPGGSEFDISESSIRSIIQQQLGQKADYPDAELGAIYPLGAHPPGQSNRTPIIGAAP